MAPARSFTEFVGEPLTQHRPACPICTAPEREILERVYRAVPEVLGELRLFADLESEEFDRLVEAHFGHWLG